MARLAVLSRNLARDEFELALVVLIRTTSPLATLLAVIADTAFRLLSAMRSHRMEMRFP